MYLDPNLQTLNPKPSSGQRFGESKFNLEKSCFLLEKKKLIMCPPCPSLVRAAMPLHAALHRFAVEMPSQIRYAKCDGGWTRRARTRWCEAASSAQHTTPPIHPPKHPTPPSPHPSRFNVSVSLSVLSVYIFVCMFTCVCVLGWSCQGCWF